MWFGIEGDQTLLQFGVWVSVERAGPRERLWLGGARAAAPGPCRLGAPCESGEWQAAALLGPERAPPECLLTSEWKALRVSVERGVGSRLEEQSWTPVTAGRPGRVSR